MIDSHHHLWQYSAQEYGWIDDSMKVIRRDFLPKDIRRETSAVGIDGVVTVQARQTVEETRWLLELAEKNAFMRGVVGWVPLIQPNVSAILTPFAGNPKLKAVRHVIQDEADPNYILRDDFNRGIAALHHFGLVYDILIFERHLPQAIKFVDRHPNQIFVLDHIAKPRIKDHVISPWRENIREMAKRPHVYCKVSGMVTEADHKAWKDSDLDPYFDTVFEAFGPRRLMYGSDWPVCLLATTYSRWFQLVSKKIAHFSAAERERIMGGTAIEAYRL